MQNDWRAAVAERTQCCADMGDMRAFYGTQNAFRGPSIQIQAPLRSSDGSTLLTDKEAILKRWSGHFEDLFSDQRAVPESTLATVFQVNVKLELCDPSTHEEIKKVTLQQKVGKAPGTEGTSKKVYQSISVG